MENDRNNGRQPQVDSLIKRLKEAKTVPELDAMRKEIVQAMHAIGTEEAFHQLQDAFIDAQYRLTMMEQPAGRRFLERMSALEEQVQQLTKERDELLKYVKTEAECPLCAGVSSCDDDCPFMEDNPEAADRLINARNTLAALDKLNEAPQP